MVWAIKAMQKDTMKKKPGVPNIPGSRRIVTSVEEGLKIAAEIKH